MNQIYLERSKDLELLNAYTSQAGIDISVNKLTDQQGIILFNLILKDYKTGKISVDNLSTLCELMYGKFSTGSDIYDLLLNGAEIEWYIRNEPAIAADFICDLLTFFK